MNEKEAKELIKKFVLENFDDRWHPEPTFFAEYPDFYEFAINSKEYFNSRDFHHVFIGLGSSYISKKYGEIVQYGSALSSDNSRRDFLKTEHKLSIVRTKYEIERTDFYYNVSIQNIADNEKASKYIDGIQIYSGNSTYEELLNHENLEFTSLNYFGLLNLLYFNIINPFCKISYEKKILKGHDDIKWLRSYSSLNSFDAEDTLFEKFMLNKVKKQYPSFNIYKCYTSKIIGIHDEKTLYQYFPIAGFRYYGEDEPTGFVGYELSYSQADLQKMIVENKISFEFVEGKDLLFFLFMNSIISFCEIEIERIPNELIKR